MTDPTAPTDFEASGDVINEPASDDAPSDSRAATALFPEAPRRVLGYDKAAVDAFLERARQEFEGEPAADGTHYLDAAAVRTAAASR